MADIVAYHPKSLTDGLVDILRPHEMVQLVLEGGNGSMTTKVLGDFLYGGMQVEGEQHGIPSKSGTES